MIHTHFNILFVFSVTNRNASYKGSSLGSSPGRKEFQSWPMSFYTQTPGRPRPTVGGAERVRAWAESWRGGHQQTYQPNHWVPQHPCYNQAGRGHAGGHHHNMPGRSSGGLRGHSYGGEYFPRGRGGRRYHTILTCLLYFYCK